MIAIEAKYHHCCLCSLYNRTRQAAPKDNKDDSRLHGMAFAELVAFMVDLKYDDNTPVFKLIDIAEQYKITQGCLGVIVEKKIHTKRLKNRMLSALPDLRA